MATKSNKRDNMNTPDDEWLPVGYDAEEVNK
jgi:hypothetical protein